MSPRSLDFSSKVKLFSGTCLSLNVSLLAKVKPSIIKKKLKVANIASADAKL